MSRIRSENTGPELMVFRFLRRNQIYFQKHYKRVRAKPDIALPRKKRAVFIDGDFWHGRTLDQRRATLPEAWITKIQRNIDRDVERRQELVDAGWTILQVWESDLLANPDSELQRVKEFLTSD